MQEKGKENEDIAVRSEVEILRRQLAMLQEKIERSEEDRLVSSFNTQYNKEKRNTSNKKRKKKKKSTETNSKKKTSKGFDEQSIASDSSEICKSVHLEFKSSLIHE